MAGGLARVKICLVEKINRPIRKSLSILWPGGNVSRAVELEPYYDEFQQGVSIEDIAERIVALHNKDKFSGRMDLSFYDDYRNVQEHIVCRLVNYGLNRELLEKIPHIRFLDLVVVYYYDLDWDLHGKGSILVRNGHLYAWGIQREQLLFLSSFDYSKIAGFVLYCSIY